MTDVVKRTSDCLLYQIDELSKYTHINRDSFGLCDKENIVAIDTLSSLYIFLSEYINSKIQIEDFLESELQEIFYDYIVENEFDKFSHLSWYQYISDVWINEVKIDSIDSKNVESVITGSVSVDLHCSKDSGETDKDTYLWSQSCPFKAQAICPVDNFKEVEISNIEIETNEEQCGFYRED